MKGHSDAQDLCPAPVATRSSPLAVVAIAAAGRDRRRPPPSHAATVDTAATYVFVNRNSGKAMDLCDWPRPTTRPLQAVRLQRPGSTCSSGGSSTSAAASTRCVNVHSGKVLDVPDCQRRRAAAAVALRSAATANQHFRLADSAGGVRAVHQPDAAARRWTCGSGRRPTARRSTQFTDLRRRQPAVAVQPVGGGTGGGRAWSNIADGFAQGTTGGAGGQTVTVTTQAAAQPVRDRERARTSSGSPARSTSRPKGTELRVASNKTIIGVGTSGHIVGGGFFLGVGVSNVIIRNLTIRDTLMPDDDPGDDAYDYDAIQMDTANRIWIDHNRLTPDERRPHRQPQGHHQPDRVVEPPRRQQQDLRHRLDRPTSPRG